MDLPGQSSRSAIPANADPLVRWLYGVAALVVAIVVVGGLTRITESGLSITQWKPVTGVLPPLSEAQWQAEFEAYKQIGQYIKVNGPAGMSLADYKFIYFWEWIHRLLGRVIGVAFALPLAWFWLRRRIPPGYKPRLLLLLALGGLQGVIGWWMVSSGLGADAGDRVDPLRLATHLMVALITLGALVWTALDLKCHGQSRPAARLSGFSAVVLAMLALQLLLGALVAGNRAGTHGGAGWFNWDAWPLMQGRFFPEGVNWASGLAHAAIYDGFLVHFLHRWWAWIVAAALVVMGRKLRQAQRRDISVALHSAFGAQILLGIAAIWSAMAPWLAVAHQLVGALLVIATVWGAHALGRR